MKILHVKPSTRKKGRFLVTLENGDLLRVTEEELLHFGLRPELELTEEQMTELNTSAERSAVRVKAANIIGSRPLSKSELEKRLVQKGACAEDAAEAADWLEELGAVDDRQYAAMLVRHYGSRGYGAGRVREELRRRGVDRELWDEALEQLPNGDDTLDNLIQRRAGDMTDPKAVRRLTDFLLRRGFPWGEVKDAIRRYTDLLDETE